MTEKIWAIVLAAGESSRMGSPKMLIPFGGKTMIETVIDNILQSSVNKIVVVLGAYREDISARIKHLPVLTCYNDNYRNGMLSSVQCGMRILPPDFEAVFVFPGDQPLVGPDIIDKMLGEYRNIKKGIIIPVYKAKRGHPVLIDSKYREAVENLDDSKGLRMLAEIYPDEVVELETNSPGIIKDFDTLSDFNIETIK